MPVRTLPFTPVAPPPPHAIAPERAVPIAELPFEPRVLAMFADQLAGNRDGLLQESELDTWTRYSAHDANALAGAIGLHVHFLRALQSPPRDGRGVADALRGAAADGVVSRADWDLLVAPALSTAPPHASDASRAVLALWGEDRVRLDPHAHRAIVEHLRSRGYPIGVGTPRSNDAARAALRDNVTERDDDFAALVGVVERATGKAVEPVLVACADGGFDVTHPALVSKLWTNPRDPLNGLDDDANGVVDDVHGVDVVGLRADLRGHPHGTHVAGLATRGTDRVRVLSTRVIDAAGQPGRTDDMRVAAGVAYGAFHGARVINMSFGSTAPDPAQVALIERVMRAYPDTLFCIAAGNDNEDLSAPSAAGLLAGIDMPNVMVVAASGVDGAPAPFTALGKTATIAAPGVDVFSTVPPDAAWKDASDVDFDAGVFHERPDFGFAAMSGTSMATPLVVDVAAKMRALCPSLTAAEVKSILVATSHKSAAWTGRVQAGGVVDEAAALREAAYHALARSGVDATNARVTVGSVARPPPAGHVPRPRSATFDAAFPIAVAAAVADGRVDAGDVQALAKLLAAPDVSNAQVRDALLRLHIEADARGATFDADAKRMLVAWLATRLPTT